MDTIAAVDRSWSQMTDDMQFLAQRLKWASQVFAPLYVKYAPSGRAEAIDTVQ